MCSPEVTYEFIDCVDFPPGTFTCSLQVNGETFVQNAGSKKLARSMAAAEALRLMFSYIWDPTHGKYIIVSAGGVCVCVREGRDGWVCE